MTAPIPLACVDFSGIAGCPGCCGSCHADACDDGYGDTSMCCVPDDQDGEVCCEINGWLCGLHPDERMATTDAARRKRDERAAC